MKNLAVVFIISLLSCFATADSTTYNFDGVTRDTNDHFAYAYDVDTFPFGGDTSNRNNGVEATDTQYAAISADNTSQWATTDPGNGDEILLWIEIMLITSV